MIDRQALDAHLTSWARKKNLAGVSAYIAGPNGCEYAWNYGFRDAAQKTCPAAHRCAAGGKICPTK